MGNCCFRKTSSEMHPKNVTLLLVGLDKSGKTTIAKRLAGEPIDCVVPTIGFSVLTLRQKGCRVSIYDLGGGPQIRDIWPRYYADVHGVIFVVDAAAEDRMDECKQVLRQVLENERISRKPVLLLANKQDLEGALDEIDVVDRLNLEKTVNDLKCPTLVELSSAIQFSRTIDIGLDNGYKWLIRSIMKDYPSLNNRVLQDFAKQEEENRIQFFKILTKNEKKEVITCQNGRNSLKPIRKVLEERKEFSKTADWIPQHVQAAYNKTSKRKTSRFLNRKIASNSHSQSFENIRFNLFQSEIEMKCIKDADNQSFKNFMVRPKSSNARLNGVRTEKKKKRQRRTQFKKLNKTVTNLVVPLADFSNQNQQSFQTSQVLNSEIKVSESNVPFVKVSDNSLDKNNLENANPFTVTHNLGNKEINKKELSFFEEKFFYKATQASKMNPERS